ncbi:Fic family protein [Candidatus Woesearchaeota archaeon]|nr:Fic family protein [Candidatus Woesearchaeota archaeon]
MVYIYRKMVGGRPYYYLRVSERKSGKLVVKDVAYLGSAISEVEDKLNNLSEFQDEIRKSHRNIKKFLQSNYYLEQVRKRKIKTDEYISLNVLEQLEAAKLHFNSHVLRQDPTTILETYEHFLVDFAFNTTSIEGNTITLKEAERLLREEIMPKDRTLREVHDLQNTEKVFFWLLNQRPLLNENLLIEVHDRLLENIDKRKGYRDHEIRVFRSRFDASPAKYVKTDVGLLLKSLKIWEKRLHPLVLAAVMHHKMEKIHPFSDGNGRTGRMLMNYLMIMNGYPPMVVPKKRRREYLDALARADKAALDDVGVKHYSKLVEYLSAELIQSYWENFNI